MKRKSCETLTATIDADANHVLIEHKQSGCTATYHCAIETGELDGATKLHQLTQDEIDWLISIAQWVEDSGY